MTVRLKFHDGPGGAFTMPRFALLRCRDWGFSESGEGSNPTVNFHREKRSNQTHCSTTDPDAMLSRKSRGSGAVLAYRGHLLTEHRNGLVVSALTTQAYGSAERDAALRMAESLPGTHRVTLG